MKLNNKNKQFLKASVYLIVSLKFQYNIHIGIHSNEPIEVKLKSKERLTSSVTENFILLKLARIKAGEILSGIGNTLN